MFSNRRQRANAGVTSMEVAITFGLFIVLFLGVVDLSRYLFSQQGLTTLVTATARRVYANGTLGSCSGIPSAPLASAYAPLLDQSQLSPIVACQSNGTGLIVLTVTATYNFTSVTPGLETLIGPMTASVTYKY